jgi:hypothetical protein
MHAGRIAYLMAGEPVITEPAFLSSAGGGCPMAAAAEAAPAEAPTYSPVRFGRLFDRWGIDLREDKLMEIAQALIDLGRCMDDPRWCHKGDAGGQEPSEIPAGYTYLGQFITHEITFDKTDGLPLVELTPENGRSPSLDLDSLYGDGPGDEKSKRLYDEARPARLRVGTTQAPNAVFGATFENDLPREEKDGRKGVAVIGDERNDENLPLAQTHVAFIKFHNRVVEDLEAGRYKDFAPPAAGQLFETACAEVVKHFQWIILKDYLPRIVDGALVESLIRKPDKFNKPTGPDDLFIPLEFSAAAFRIGHTMVRRRYRWNRRHEPDVALFELFTHTRRSGDLDGLERLDSTWVADWKRLYDFTSPDLAADYPPPYNPPQGFNRAGRIDTVFDLHLNTIKGFDHQKLSLDRRPITVRNLLRGLALGLPWGEDVAEALGEKLGAAELAELRDVPHPERLTDPALGGKTPLWFYVLRESRLKGGPAGKLGPVGSRIVADTLVGLIRHSRYSILRPKQAGGEGPEWELSDWRPAPAYGRQAPEPERVKFEMPDLLRAADVVDPLGKRVSEAQHAHH